jgi:hypothetical protein
MLSVSNYVPQTKFGRHIVFVWRVTCYDHFCVFHIFLAFWPFSWQRQPFWKNQPLKFDQDKFKMGAVAMVTKVQKMLNSLQTADPFET